MTQDPGVPAPWTTLDASEAPVLFGLPRHQRNYSILLVSVGLLALAFNTILSTHDDDLKASTVAIVAFLFVLTAASPGLRLRRGEEYPEYKFWAYPSVVSLAVAPAYLVITCFALTFGALCAKTFIQAPEKRNRALVDFGAMSVAATLGCYIASTYEPYTFPVGCMVVAVCWEGIFYGYDVTRGGRAYALHALWDSLDKRLAVPALSALVSTGLVFVLGPQREFLFFVPLSALVLYWLVEGRSNAMEEKAAWRQMEAISSQFIGELDEHNAIQLALKDSVRVFAARYAEVVLFRDGQDTAAEWSLRSGPGERVEVNMPVGGEVSAPPEMLSRHEQVLFLTVGDHQFGYMRLEWDPLAPVKESLRSLTNTFGHSVAACIANTRHNRQVQHQASEKAREAEHDPLTSLGNRTRLASHGPLVLNESSDVNRQAALLLFDLDGFKRINDTLGHAAGDQVLAEVARRVREAVRQSDVTIRLGGDEFAILAGDLEVAADAERLASKINRALIPPIEIQDLQLSIEASIGIAMYPTDATDIQSLLKMADIAMYRSKTIGRGKTTRYNKDIDSTTPSRCCWPQTCAARS